MASNLFHYSAVNNQLISPTGTGRTHIRRLAITQSIHQLGLGLWSALVRRRLHARRRGHFATFPLEILSVGLDLRDLANVLRDES